MVTNLLSQEGLAWNAPNPRREVCHPLFLLEDYLESVSSKRKNDDKETSTTRSSTDAMIDEILRVTEFLFGSAQLTAALTLLDAHTTNFTRVASPHRHLWLVQGSGDFSYMCISTSESDRATTSLSPLYYCNCRSLFDKVSRQLSSQVPLPEICKHLLALKLIPYLNLSCPEISVSDEEFAQIVLDRTMGPPPPV